MSPRRFLAPACSLAALLTLAGCSDTHDDVAHDEPHGHHDHDEDELTDGDTSSPARFQAGQGLLLAPATAAALGLRTAEVGERPTAHTFEVTASVFDAGPPARASALMPANTAAALERHPPTEARVLSVRRDIASALGQVEVVLEISGQPAVGSSANLTLHSPARASLAVPRAALLRTATGMFVYVRHGAHFLRTPVRPGAGNEEFIEIIHGLRAGDVVATTAVQQLWLTELRLTKGGGHSH
ncbi:MAG: hypothetical protein QM691_18490 [Opitutaceae bacterium]